LAKRFRGEKYCCGCLKRVEEDCWVEGEVIHVDVELVAVVVVAAAPLKMCSMTGDVVEEEVLPSFLFDKSKPDEIERRIVT
jgi:hypothetical protein